MWEIIDSKGTVHSGSEEEMRTAFDVMTMNSNSFCKEYSLSLKEWTPVANKYITEWTGDLKLVEVYKTYR